MESIVHTFQYPIGFLELKPFLNCYCG